MRAIVLVGLTLVIAGCSGNASEATHVPERNWVDFAADTLWVRGGLQDSLLQMPLAIAADAERVYVSDLGSHRVVALDAASGQLAWIAGRRGSGPEEFERPAALALLPDSRLAVSDTRNGRIALLTRDGEALSTFRVHDPEINGLCGLADGSLVTVSARKGPMIGHVSPDGVELSRLDVPWPELADVSALARQAAAAARPDGSACVIALTMGRGFAFYRDSAFAGVHDYVEPVPVPQVEVTVRGDEFNQTRSERLVDAVRGARAITVGSDALFVAFIGATDDRGRILDEYGLDGTYRHSHRLAARPSDIAWVDGTIFVLTHPDGIPTLTAMRIREGT